MTTPPSSPSQPARRSDGSKNVALLQEVWRQAHISPEPFRIPCGTEVEANRMRTALYNAVRNVKKFPADYPTMTGPVQDCEIVKDDTDPTVLIIRQKILSPRMQGLKQLLAARGVEIGEEALKGTAESREIQASMDRLVEQLSAEPSAAPATPALQLVHPVEAPAIPNPYFQRDKQ